MIGSHDSSALARRRSRGFIGLLAVCLLGTTAVADTVVLKRGKALDDVVVSRNDDEFIVVNPFRSRNPDMTWGIEDEHRIPRANVEEVIVADPPLVEYRRRAARPDLSAEEHVALARFCEEQDLEDHAEWEWERALAADPENADAVERIGASRLKTLRRGNPLLLPELRELERRFVAESDPGEVAALWARMKELGTSRSLTYLMRARRSAAEAKGRFDEQPLTLGAARSPGATFCLFVPNDYDPLRPTPLLIGLHGGGAGGRDRRIVTGSGEAAMNFYQRLAQEWGMVVACPSALAAPWAATENGPLLDDLVAELLLRFNVDRSRVHLIGHSMGGFGTWHWGAARSDLWAAIAPCAGGGGPNGIDKKGVPIYVFHGGDDGIVGPASDRAAARHFADQRKPPDFVYTELNGVGHGFPDVVRRDIFDFFAGRRKDQGRKVAVRPDSSFDEKVGRDEKKLYGDPSKLPPLRAAEADASDLVDTLSGGGGAAVEAAEQLVKLGGADIADDVAKVLRSKKAAPDARTLAANVLGRLGVVDALDDLARAARDEEHTVVTAVAEAAGALGALDAERAASVLRAATKRLSEFFAASFTGDRVSFTEYELRTQALAVSARAWAKLGAVPDVFPSVREHIVEPVFLPAEEHVIPVDSRFVHIPPRARLHLAKAVAEALAACGHPEAGALAGEVSERWRSEAAIADALSGVAAD